MQPSRGVLVVEAARCLGEGFGRVGGQGVGPDVVVVAGRITLAGKDVGEVRQAVAKVRLFFEQYGEARFDPLDRPEARPSPNRAGWRKGDGEEREWLIPPEIWKDEICSGLNPTFVAQTLHLRGMLEKARDGYQLVRRIGGDSKRVYVVNSLIFAGGDEENSSRGSRFSVREELSRKVA